MKTSVAPELEVEAVDSRRRLRVIAWPALETRAMNPYTWLLYTNMDADVTDFSLRKAVTGGCDADILHVHWPETLLNQHSLPIAAAKAKALFRVMDRMRARGAKVVWTFHNEKSHERKHARFEGWFWEELTGRVDGVFALSRTGERVVHEQRLLRDTPVFVVPHGHYRGEYFDDPRVDERSELGIPAGARVILFFGQIRPYKNVPALIESFVSLASDDIVLLIAGKAAPGLEAEIRSCSGAHPGIRLHLRTIEPDKVFLFFRAADLVVLPYREILNSGTALLALSFDKPVLVPNKGAMGELAVQVGTEWVRTYEGEIGGPVLADALLWHSAVRRPDRPQLDHLSWPVIGRATLDAYRQLLGSPQPRYSN
jgi:beta-1,4-mannosyltransferase